MTDEGWHLTHRNTVLYFSLTNYFCIWIINNLNFGISRLSLQCLQNQFWKYSPWLCLLLLRLLCLCLLWLCYLAVEDVCVLFFWQ